MSRDPQGLEPPNGENRWDPGSSQGPGGIYRQLTATKDEDETGGKTEDFETGYESFPERKVNRGIGEDGRDSTPISSRLLRLKFLRPLNGMVQDVSQRPSLD